MDQDSSHTERTTSTPPDKTAEPDGVVQVDQKKQDEIRAACAEADIPELQRLAESAGGFLTDKLRQLACTPFHTTFLPYLRSARRTTADDCKPFLRANIAGSTCAEHNRQRRAVPQLRR